jgi:hypothetical protein
MFLNLVNFRKSKKEMKSALKYRLSRLGSTNTQMLAGSPEVSNSSGIHSPIRATNSANHRSAQLSCTNNVILISFVFSALPVFQPGIHFFRFHSENARISSRIQVVQLWKSYRSLLSAQEYTASVKKMATALKILLLTEHLQKRKRRV